MKSFLIIGMGSFGHHLCRCMAQQSVEIMVVDRDSAKVEDVLSLVTSAKIGDCTNPEVLQSFGVTDFDACFVCIGEDFQNSLEITNLLKEQGAKKVYSEATQDMQEKFLLRNGADHVVFPEKDIAARIAVSESSDSIFDFISLSNDYGIFEIGVPRSWAGQTLQQLNIRAKYNLNILASRSGQEVRPIISADYVFRADEHVMVMGHINDIHKVVR